MQGVAIDARERPRDERWEAAWLKSVAAWLDQGRLVIEITGSYPTSGYDGSRVVRTQDRAFSAEVRLGVAGLSCPSCVPFTSRHEFVPADVRAGDRITIGARDRGYEVVVLEGPAWHGGLTPA